MLPLYFHSGIVGQYKFWEGVLSLGEMGQDLMKSDKYPAESTTFTA